MYRLNRFAFTLVAFTALACAAPETGSGDTTMMATADPMAVRAAIDSANMRAAAGINAGNVAEWASAYADDAIVMQANQPAWRGKADLQAKATAMLNEVTLSNAMFTTEDVMVSGDLAVETGSYTMTITPKAGGTAMQERGKYVAVWKRQPDGSWKIVRDVGNSDMPPAK